MTGFLQQMVRFLTESVTENVGLKALSLSFAIGLFAFLYGQQEEQQRTFPVAIVVRPPSEDAQRELMTQIPANLHVTLRGSARAIDGLIETGLQPVELDLRQTQLRQVVFDEKMFQEVIPPDTEITFIDPPSLDLDWDDLISRQLPVQASIAGQPADGYVVRGKPEVEPPQITARGPSRLVEVIQFARLVPFDVSGLSEGAHRRRLAIDAPPSRVRFIGPSSAAVTVTIGRRISEARFENRPIEVIGVPGAAMVPRAADVTVLGPPEVVRALKADQVVPRADLTTVEGLDLKRHGSAVVKLNVELTHAEVEIQPPTVTVKW